MPGETITTMEGRGVYVPGDDINTDRILPARYMLCVTFDGLGEHLFHDERFGKDGSLLRHPLDDPRHRGACVLLSGRNFGCGSSREHAPQALRKFGIRVLMAESFAEIFAGNCTTLGMPCVQMPGAEVRKIAAAIEKDPQALIRVDLAARTAAWPGGSAALAMKDGVREVFLSGQWDALAQLLDGRKEAAALAARLGYCGA